MPSPLLPSQNPGFIVKGASEISKLEDLVTVPLFFTFIRHWSICLSTGGTVQDIEEPLTFFAMVCHVAPPSREYWTVKGDDVLGADH